MIVKFSKFESTGVSGFDINKKYFVYKYISRIIGESYPITYYIDRFKNLINERIELNTLGCFSNGTFDKFIDESPYSTNFNKYKESVIFSSDNFDECVNFIKLVDKQSKYNL